MSGATAPPRLRMCGVSKRFDAVVALDGVDFDVAAGEVHALMGENGAGKSTLIKVLAGALRADAGHIAIDGRDTVLASPHDARRAGVAVVHQELALAPNLTVAENLVLGVEPRRYGLFVDRRARRQLVATALARLGAALDPDAIVATLAPAEQQLVEIARALLGNARLLVLDEPTASLSERETERLFALIRTLRADGLAVVYVSHRLYEIEALADRVTVLRDGRRVGGIARAELTGARLIEMMCGRPLGELFPVRTAFRRGTLAADGVAAHAAPTSAPTSAPSAPAFEFSGYADRAGRVRDVSFAIRGGEVLGLAGLVGSGRTELARLVFGADPRASGVARADARLLQIAGPRDALAHGICYVPEDRRTDGLLMDRSVQDNLALGVLGRFARGGFVARRPVQHTALELMRELAIKTAGTDAPARSLSGGNQQKVLVGRALARAPCLLILDEPTRGVDAGAKREIYALIRALADKGVAVLLISSELNEILGLADRVLVMREGRLAGELDPARGDAIDEANVLALAFGTRAAA